MQYSARRPTPGKFKATGNEHCAGGNPRNGRSEQLCQLSDQKLKSPYN